MKEAVEDAVRGLLEEIHEHPRLNLHVPHGFELEDLTVEEHPNLFAPASMLEWTISARLSVPVIYSPDSSCVPVRASLPARHENLDRLRSWIADCAYQAQIGRLGLRQWAVSPDEAPVPYLPNGQPAGPPAHWSVTATFDAF